MQDDEWMYQLDEAMDPAEFAVHACVKGDYAEAVRLLGGSYCAVKNAVITADENFCTEDAPSSLCRLENPIHAEVFQPVDALRCIANFLLFHYNSAQVTEALNVIAQNKEMTRGDAITDQDSIAGHNCTAKSQPHYEHPDLPPAVPRVDLTLASLCVIPQLMSVL